MERTSRPRGEEVGDHVESPAFAEPLNQDTFYWGTLKGVGKVYVQVAVDTFCSPAFAKCYSPTMPITACDLLYERVLPFYDALGVPVQAILTDNGRDFCGKPESHPYELLLAIEDIDHRNAKMRLAQRLRQRASVRPIALMAALEVVETHELVEVALGSRRSTDKTSHALLRGSTRQGACGSCAQRSRWCEACARREGVAEPEFETTEAASAETAETQPQEVDIEPENTWTATAQ